MPRAEPPGSPEPLSPAGRKTGNARRESHAILFIAWFFNHRYNEGHKGMAPLE